MRLAGPCSLNARLIGFAGFLVVVAGVLFIGRQPAEASRSLFDGDPLTSARVATDTPAATAVAISQARFGGGQAAHVVLARDDLFTDSLAGAPLSAEGPLLFTSSARLADSVLTEITRVLPPRGRVYLLGGEQAITPAVAISLERAGFVVQRLAGVDRVATALEIATAVRGTGGDKGRVAIARADDWADSVSGGAWAASQGVPLLVTDGKQLDDRVAKALRAWKPREVVLLGGEAALSARVAKATSQPTRRIAGPDRNATAVAIAKQLWTSPKQRFLLVNGRDTYGWAYGFAAAGLAADAGAPVLLVTENDVPSATFAVLRPCSSDVVVMGGEAAVGEGVLQASASCAESVSWPVEQVCDTLLPGEVRGALKSTSLSEVDDVITDAQASAQCSWNNPKDLWRRIVVRKYDKAGFKIVAAELGSRRNTSGSGVATVVDPGSVSVVIGTKSNAMRLDIEARIGDEAPVPLAQELAHTVWKRLR